MLELGVGRPTPNCLKRRHCVKVAEIVKEKIEPIVNESNLKLVDVEYTKLHDGMHLIVYIDKEGGVNVEDCSALSSKIDPILEELNPTNDEAYYFDVMSYGLDKPLKYDWQLEKYKGQKICIKLYSKLEGKKDFAGILVNFDKDNLIFNLNGQDINLDRKLIAQILPYVEF